MTFDNSNRKCIYRRHFQQCKSVKAEKKYHYSAQNKSENYAITVAFYSVFLLYISENTENEKMFKKNHLLQGHKFKSKRLFKSY